ncbi:MAG: hypothetical protein ACRCYY_13225 [Trueperaceae bacterium]
MADLLFWFLVSQTIAGLPDMAPGTVVNVVSSDLTIPYASATIESQELILEGAFPLTTELRVLIFQPNATPEEKSQALGQALPATVSPEGDDLHLKFQELEGPLSFKKWLLEERGIVLRIIPTGSQ